MSRRSAASSATGARIGGSTASPPCCSVHAHGWQKRPRPGWGVSQVALCLATEAQPYVSQFTSCAPCVPAFTSAEIRRRQDRPRRDLSSSRLVPPAAARLADQSPGRPLQAWTGQNAGRGTFAWYGGCPLRLSRAGSGLAGHLSPCDTRVSKPHALAPYDFVSRPSSFPALDTGIACGTRAIEEVTVHPRHCDSRCNGRWPVSECVPWMPFACATG